MAKKFTQTIPRKPLLRRNSYHVPKTYSAAYSKEGITDQDKQIMLFHLTQFGGFRIVKMPRDLHIDQDFLSRWFKYSCDFGYHSYRASTEFLTTFGGLAIQPLEKKWRTSVVNDKEMAERGFSRDETRAAASFLSRLNNFYSSLRLNIDVPRSGITTEDMIRLSRFHGIPYLVKKPKAGGRFFQPESSYQRIPSPIRRMLTLNGESISELDLTAAVIQFLNVVLKKNGLKSLEDSILVHADPYQYFLAYLSSDQAFHEYEEQPFEREALKTVLYTAIYSSAEKQEQHVNHKLRRMGRRYTHKHFVSLFPDFFNALSALRSATSLPLHMVIYREESRYAQEVLQEGCLERKLPILPLHDSFITTSGNAAALYEIMNNASSRLYGKLLVHRQKY
jgi:hypothetical protein